MKICTQVNPIPLNKNFSCSLHKKRSFALRISSVNVTKLAVPADVVTFTDRESYINYVQSQNILSNLIYLTVFLCIRFRFFFFAKTFIIVVWKVLKVLYTEEVAQKYNFAKFTGKHLCQSHVQAWGLQLY